MADELIYKDLLLHEISKTIKHISKKEDDVFDSFAVGMCLAFKKMVNEQPIIEAKPVVHAYWERKNILSPLYCSKCGETALRDLFEDEFTSKYCPNCGARMDEKEDANG